MECIRKFHYLPESWVLEGGGGVAKNFGHVYMRPKAANSGACENVSAICLKNNGAINKCVILSKMAAFQS